MTIKRKRVFTDETGQLQTMLSVVRPDGHGAVTIIEDQERRYPGLVRARLKFLLRYVRQE